MAGRSWNEELQTFNYDGDSEMGEERPGFPVTCGSYGTSFTPTPPTVPSSGNVHPLGLPTTQPPLAPRTNTPAAPDNVGASRRCRFIAFRQRPYRNRNRYTASAITDQMERLGINQGTTPPSNPNCTMPSTGNVPPFGLPTTQPSMAPTTNAPAAYGCSSARCRLRMSRQRYRHRNRDETSAMIDQLERLGINRGTAPLTYVNRPDPSRRLMWGQPVSAPIPNLNLTDGNLPASSVMPQNVAECPNIFGQPLPSNAPPSFGTGSSTAPVQNQETGSSDTDPYDAF